MKSNTSTRRALRGAIFGVVLAVPAGLLGQSSEGALVTVQEDRQKEMAKLQERVIERTYKVGQLQNADGPVAAAKETSQKLLRSLKDGQMEEAARLYWEGYGRRVPKIMQEAAKVLDEAAKQAMADAVNIAGWTSGSGPRRRPDPAPDGIAGPAAAQAAQILAEVEADRQTLQQDSDAYVAALCKDYPELSTRLAQAGLTPGSMRDIAKRSMSEADQFKYLANLYRVSAIVWDSMPTIIKTRALTGGKAQAVIQKSAEETIRQAGVGIKLN